ncbi:glycoside hydrolase family 2 TIM barrel-domain containing protein [Mangrovihabitans endophyticus]|uniref:Beta-galactosidase n=1 Tax=Mangrovihabitans endophyticus TaxID=1751298 RepID=A0A8J3C2D5_9ACTN|nr:glycoside hydrolase family 2 TIM barrel-domain containing protein [Mangrovihabitans endophyticus]GGL00278.1 beta-galactosidase [Mangrovihabitans endophyticus]
MSATGDVIVARPAVAALLVTALVAAGAPGTGPAAAAAPTGPSAASTPVGAAHGRPPAALTGTDVAVAHHEGGTWDLDGGWRFALANTTGADDPDASAADPGYDDSGWRAVTVPHDWSIELNPVAGATTTAGTGFYPGGLGWYRRALVLPRSLAGRRISVEFDGVYMDSQVYFNGRRVGAHHYGYTGFSVDLPGAHTDGHTADVLAVKVRNQVPSSRWYSGSGIYRNVRLVATGAVRVRRDGMAVTTPDVAHGVARVSTALDGADGTPVRVTSTLRDARGRVVGASSATTRTGNATLDVRIGRPHLWDVDDPYTYGVTTQVRVGTRVVDTYVSRAGFRTTRFDPRQGFFLNGRQRKLQGVNLHHDLGALGAAVNRDAILRQLRIMRGMGVNALRTSHNPPAPELIQACEQLGIVLMVEAFDVWNVGKTPYDYARFFPADGDADLAEMVRAARNSPAVIMWSIGNEIPNSWQPDAVPIARRLIDDVRALDTTRPVVMGSDKYRYMPEPGSPLEQILLMLDGVGLNYNTAASVDALHARYPDTFFFESESSSETSTRGEYDQPEQLNTGENHAPGRRAASSYDNNLASWTMSGEYALKKDRDRPWFLGQFLWSGIDYIGEPTPFGTFPVKTSFFGAVDTAGFAKDQYHLFKSQWTSAPMVHLLPGDWTGHRPGEPVQVWAYANVDTVELFLDGRSLGVRRFDHKRTAGGRAYLETTEPTGDDKTVTDGPYPGSYTGSDGTAGRLHLTWTVPYAPGRLVAVARRDGHEVARDEVRTAGAPAAVRLSTDRRVVRADGRSLAFVTADVVDRHGVVVPDADHLVRFSVLGGRVAGVDNGRQESAESSKAPYRTAFHGKALAMVTPDGPGTMVVTARADGLRTGRTVLAVMPARSAGGQGPVPVSRYAPGAPTTPVAATPPGVDGLRADASFAGAEDTPPAAMTDGDDGTAWSDAYEQPPTALLPQISAARTGDEVSVSWPHARTVDGVRAWFVIDDRHARPARVRVSTWGGGRWRPAPDAEVTWPDGDDEPTVVSFPATRTTAVRLDMTSSAPQTPGGFLGITELRPGR